jgi:hypothetical protein
MLGTTQLSAQVAGARLEGMVRDTSQAVVPGVTVTITNVETGISRTATTDAQGRYVFNLLPPAPYDLSAGLTGFKTTVRQGITLTVGAESVADLTLEIGAVAEQVTVTSEAPQVETRSAAVGGVVEERVIREIPLNGRSFADLMQLQTGVVVTRAAGRSTTAGTGEKMSLGGARPSQMSFLLDGADMMGKDGTNPAGASGIMMGVDTIQEFRVSTSGFSAEYGRNAGGVVSAVTKSGTNDLHGTVYEFLRNDNLDAAQWEDNAFRSGAKPEFKRNQFGFTVGGPIAANRTFFFGSFEGLRQRQGSTAVNNVPNAQARQDGFLVPQIAANVKPFLALYPLPTEPVPTDPTGAGGIGRYAWAGTTATNQNDYLVRLDHQLTDVDSLSGRFLLDDADQTSPGSLGLLGNLQDSRMQSYVINHKRIFGASLVNDFRATFTRTRLTVDDVIPDSMNALEFIQGRGFGLLQPSQLQSISTGGTNPRFWTQNVFEYIDDVAMAHGAHTFKMGGILKRIQFNGFSAARYRGQFNFTSLVNFLRGTVDRFEAANVFHGTRGMRQWLAGMYFQDDWRMSPKLTLNLGLRYEFVTSPVEVNGKISNLRNQLDSDVTVGNPFFQNPSLKNFAPRFGFAYDPWGDGRTAIRGGFGIYYDQLLQIYYRDNVFRVLPFQQRFLVTAQTLPPGLPAIPFPNAGDLFLSQPPATRDPNVQIDLANWNPHQPYAMQYNLTIQRQMTSDFTVMLGYLGSQARNNARNVNWNNMLPAGTVNGQRCWSVAGSPCFVGPFPARRNPNFSAILQRQMDTNSNYNSLQLQVRKRYSRGLDLNLVYQLSRTMDEISGIGGSTDFDNITSFSMDPEDRGRDYSRAAFDIRHYMTISGSYEVPSFGRTGVAGRALGGWKLTSLLNYSSGEPLTVVNAFDRAGNNTMIFGSQERPDVVSGGSNNPISGTTAGCTFSNGIPGPYDSSPGAAGRSVRPGLELGTPALWFDPCQFTLQSPGLLGNVGRNTVQSPGLIRVDLGVLKSFPVSESNRVEFRWELFNLFNHANFSGPSSSVFSNATTFNQAAGTITSTEGSARQMQFALKYIF